MTVTRTIRSDRLTGWHLGAALVMAALAMAATYDAWFDIYTIARKDEEFSHIFLVPIVAAWMVWVRRMRFRHCRPSGRIVGPLIVGLGWLTLWYGFHFGYQAMWHGGAVHRYLLVQQGVHIGEFHFLEDLARDGVYEFCYACMTNRIKGTAAGFCLRPVALR